MTNDWGLTYNMVYAVSKGKKRIYERESFAVKVCPNCNVVYEKLLMIIKENIKLFTIQIFQEEVYIQRYV